MATAYESSDTSAPQPAPVCMGHAVDIAHLPRPLVFTNGVFDLLHRGHVQTLYAARALGKSLVVGVNSDASVRRLGKGPERPLNTSQDRAALIAALSPVDMVVIFDERTPELLLDQLRPDIYVKGSDYTLATLPESRQVKAWGGRTLLAPIVPHLSTTALIQRIREA